MSVDLWRGKESVDGPGGIRRIRPTSAEKPRDDVDSGISLVPISTSSAVLSNSDPIEMSLLSQEICDSSPAAGTSLIVEVESVARAMSSGLSGKVSCWLASIHGLGAIEDWSRSKVARLVVNVDDETGCCSSLPVAGRRLAVGQASTCTGIRTDELADGVEVALLLVVVVVVVVDSSEI